MAVARLRIVLMGYKLSGKSSAGNTILGREEFDLKRSAQCVRRHGEVADRHITVIEAPGWWINEPVAFSPELLKQEIVLSVSLCPPGPHAVLLIIPVETRFKDYLRKALQGHQDLLGERVWSHTIVLFTHGDSLLDTSIEQHIESEGQDLQRLLDKCGNRYHVLNNQNRSDHTQIEELLEKIEETVAQNNGCHFEIDRKILQRINNKRRAKERMQQERVHIRSQTSECVSFHCFVSITILYRCIRTNINGIFSTNTYYSANLDFLRWTPIQIQLSRRVISTDFREHYKNQLC
uniref:AIG1-type G domain-containing protein n=1 Tax=Sinocyclocheilus grahami TaxID=75366 RepID=A0A672PB78_SINGR